MKNIPQFHGIAGILPNTMLNLYAFKLCILHLYVCDYIDCTYVFNCMCVYLCVCVLEMQQCIDILPDRDTLDSDTVLIQI